MLKRKTERVLPLMLALMLAAGLGLAGDPAAAQRLPGTGQTLTFAFTNWTGDWLPTMVTKVLVEDYLGYRVDIADLTVPVTYAMIAAGEVDVFANAFFPNQESLLAGYRGQLEVIGWHYDGTLRGWAVPTWFAEEYGVRTVQDLNNPEIARLLDLDGDGYGDLMGCEVGWTCHDQIEYKLQAYGLDRLYRQIDASEQMINIAVQSALDNREPVLFMAWTPDWLLAAYPYPEVVTFLRDPVGAWPGAEDEPRNEFGYPPGRAGILVHRDFQRRHPEAYRLMSQISVPLEAVNESVYRQVVLGETSAADLARHAREWIDANRETVDGWLAAAGLR
ncbi:MAG TPA: glycine betaine ABC transporter substrate-binding protein [Limnochordales bacterium]|nr:glycine betaine ABC transporter substrate-binding protein [Limnochordales bacterium]